LQLDLPAPLAVLDLDMSDSAVIRVRRHGNPQGPRLVLSHGNGFAIDAYFPFWSRFLRDCEVIVYDQRNHGWNPRHTFAQHTEIQMAQDMETIVTAVASAFGPRRTAGLFHSLSTIVSLLHFARYGHRWDRLILFDPPITPPAGHRLHDPARNFEIALARWSLHRKSTFNDPHELARYFKSTRRTSTWVAGAAELMARSITRPADGGGYELVCPGAYESTIYEQNWQAPVWSYLPRAAERLFIVGSDPTVKDADPPAYVCAAAAQELGIKVTPIARSGHLLEIEQPAEVERIVRADLCAHGFAIGE
jgi:pimeloyl-ACP methyl ester carboxylesterase